MEKSKGIKNYVIRYNSDPRLVTDNHTSDIMFLIDVDERNFDDLEEAIVFFSECISPITKIEELVPELKNKRKYHYILPERNIKPKHILSDKMEMFSCQEWEEILYYFEEEE